MNPCFLTSVKPTYRVVVHKASPRDTTVFMFHIVISDTIQCHHACTYKFSEKSYGCESACESCQNKTIELWLPDSVEEKTETFSSD